MLKLPIYLVQRNSKWGVTTLCQGCVIVGSTNLASGTAHKMVVHTRGDCGAFLPPSQSVPPSLQGAAYCQSPDCQCYWGNLPPQWSQRKPRGEQQRFGALLRRLIAPVVLAIGWLADSGTLEQWSTSSGWWEG